MTGKIRDIAHIGHAELLTPDPDGHAIRIYYETAKYRGLVRQKNDLPAMKSNYQRYEEPVTSGWPSAVGLARSAESPAAPVVPGQ